MATTPSNIQLQASVNAGPQQTGGIEANHSDSVVLSVVDNTGYTLLRYEIYSYPIGFPAPSGWSTDANGVYFYNTTGGSVPAFTLPASTALWGKYLFRVTGNSAQRGDQPAPDLIDQSFAIRINSSEGLHGLANREEEQFGGYIVELIHDLRLLSLVASPGAGLNAPADPAEDFLFAFGETGNLSYGEMEGDVTGPINATLVEELQGVPINASAWAAAVNGQAVVFSGGELVPGTPGIGAQDWKDSVTVATLAALPTNTRTANVLTASANGAFPAVDGITLSLNQPILVQDEANQVNNGVYTLTQVGDGSTPWQLTRRADFDSNAEVTYGATVRVESGTQAGSKFYLSTAGTITVNTSNLVFTLDATTITTGTPVQVGTANAPGSGTPLALANHVHQAPSLGSVLTVNPDGGGQPMNNVSRYLSQGTLASNAGLKILASDGTTNQRGWACVQITGGDLWFGTMLDNGSLLSEAFRIDRSGGDPIAILFGSTMSSFDFAGAGDFAFVGFGNFLSWTSVTVGLNRPGTSTGFNHSASGAVVGDPAELFVRTDAASAYLPSLAGDPGSAPVSGDIRVFSFGGSFYLRTFGGSEVEWVPDSRIEIQNLTLYTTEEASDPSTASNEYALWRRTGRGVYTRAISDAPPCQLAPVGPSTMRLDGVMGAVSTPDDVTLTTIVTIPASALPGTRAVANARVILTGSDDDDTGGRATGGWEERICISKDAGVLSVATQAGLVLSASTNVSVDPTLTYTTSGNDVLVRVTSGDDKVMLWACRVEITGLDTPEA